MALDKNLVQNINLRVNGDALSGVMQAFGKETKAAIDELGKLNAKLATGGKVTARELSSATGNIQKLVSGANTLQNILNSSSGRKKDSLLGALDEQNLGKKVAAVSRISKELSDAGRVADAAAIRIANLNAKFADLGKAGRTATKTDLAKMMNLQEAERQIKSYERTLAQLNRNPARQGDSGKALLGQIESAKQGLLAQIQNPNSSNFDRSLGKIGNLLDQYRQLPKLEAERVKASEKADAAARKSAGDRATLENKAVEVRAAGEAKIERITSAARAKERREALAASQERMRQFDVEMRAAQNAANRTAKALADTRGRTLRNVNATDPMLQSQLERGASQFKFTQDQARGFDQRALARDIDGNIQKLGRLREAMSNALSQNRGQATLDRLNTSWKTLSDKISEAIAKQRAFNNLPEQRQARTRETITDTLFGDGGFAFGKRALGLAAVSTAVYGIIGAAKDGARFVLDLEDALANLQAISGSTNVEMEVLGGQIQNVAENTKFSTLEITKAATAIAQAGFSAQETGTVLKDALSLATASGSGPAEAVDTLTSTLGAFNLQATESGHIVDVMVEGLNRSKLSINQMQAAIQYAGATAHESGVSFEELTAIAASLANAGIRSGSTIGTGLRQMLVDLKNPTEDFKKELSSLGLTMADIDVKSKGLAGVVRTLADSGFTAEQAYASFEVRAASAFLAFKGQLGGYQELSEALVRGGSAAEAQGKAMDSLSAKWQQLLNILGGGAVTFAEPFVNAFKAILDGANATFGVLGQISDALEITEGATASFGNAVNSAFTVGLAGFFVGGPIGAVIGGLAGLAGALTNGADEMDRLKGASNSAEAEMRTQRQTISAVDEAIGKLVTRSDTLRTDQAAMQAETLNLTQRFAGLSSELQGVALNYDNVLAAMKRLRRTEIQLEAVKADATAIAAQDVQRNLQGQLGTNGRDIMSYATILPDAGMASRVKGVAGKGFNANGTAEQAVSQQVELQAQINDIKRARSGNVAVQKVIDLLEERLKLVQQLAAKQAAVREAGRTKRAANELTSAGGEQRTESVLNLTKAIDEGLTANSRRAGAGDAALTKAVSGANATIAALQVQLKQAKSANDTARYNDIRRTISELKGQMSRVERSRREASEDAAKAGRGQKDAEPGTNIKAADMATRLRRAFPGIGISFARQRVPADGKIYKPGSLHAKPGGNAVDITNLPQGVSQSDIRAFIEAQGVTVPNNKNGFRDEFKDPSPHATGGHLHYGWTPKKSASENREEADLQKLMESRSQLMVDEQKKRVERIINESKAGTRSSGDMTAELEKTFAEYRKARLDDFDVSNPTGALTGAAMQIRTEARAQLEKTITEETKSWMAQLVKQISDTAQKVYSDAIKSSEEQLDAALNSNQMPVLKAQAAVDTAGNYRNKSQFDAGTEYLLNQRVRNAQNTAAQADIGAYQTQLNQATAARDTLAGSQPAAAQGSEQDIANKRALADANQRVASSSLALATAQRSYNAATGEYIALPLNERLQGAVAAWADNSGAMQDWGTQMVNAVGPAIDMLASNLTDLFSSIVTGTASVQDALVSFMASFAKFVVQLIAKALALMAVKAILSAFGFELGSSAGGTVITRKAPGQMTGGPAGEPRKFMNGGSPGLVTQGVSNRDSVDATLARDEYVVRGKSVKSLGIPFMDAINEHGSKALDKLGGAPIVAMAGGHQEMNVYVVKPDEKPTMGPNDVLLTISDDIMQGGVTKQLIRRVSQGG